MRLSSIRRRRYRYDYYQIKLPCDLITPDHPDWTEGMSWYAINQARELARLWCVPCHWEAQLIEGDKDSWECVFKVRRKRVISQEIGSK
jgi:hypothetical protein